MDSLTDQGSKLLMDKILDYWETRGYNIKVWREYVPSERKRKAGMYFIRSNLINGFPVDVS